MIRTEALGMNFSQYVQQLIRKDLSMPLNSFSVVAEQNVSGTGNIATQKNFSSTSLVPAAKSPTSKRGRNKKPPK